MNICQKIMLTMLVSAQLVHGAQNQGGTGNTQQRTGRGRGNQNQTGSNNTQQWAGGYDDDGTGDQNQSGTGNVQQRGNNNFVGPSGFTFSGNGNYRNIGNVVTNEGIPGNQDEAPGRGRTLGSAEQPRSGNAVSIANDGSECETGEKIYHEKKSFKNAAFNATQSIELVKCVVAQTLTVHSPMVTLTKSNVPNNTVVEEFETLYLEKSSVGKVNFTAGRGMIYKDKSSTVGDRGNGTIISDDDEQ